MNSQTKEFKRLFFAFEVSAPWPQEVPKGRLLPEEDRHLTAVFLGHTNFAALQPLLPLMPLPSIKVGLAGNFDKVIFLPPKHPRVASWHVSWFDDPQPLQEYARKLTQWLKEGGFNPDDREELLYHVTLARAPFNFEAWRKAFQKLPIYLKALHLYESVGHLHYSPIWTHPLVLPFEELEHTADIAFLIRGESVSQLFSHAFLALAFKCPELLKFQQKGLQVGNIDEVVIQLNHCVCLLDANVGSPFKAVSFHGDIVEEGDGTLSWEMIVDV